MQVNLYDVIDAIENTIEGNTWYYYIPMQKIIGRNADGFYGEGVSGELPMKDVIELPDHRTVNDYGNMERFIEYEVKGEAQEWLKNSIKGRGAFRRFRGTLERFLLTDEWYDYLFECHRNTAIDWCEQNGIVYTEEEPVEEDDAYDDYDEEESYEEAPPRTENIVRIEPLRVVRITEQNLLNLVFPAAKFTVVMSMKQNRKEKEDPDQAEEHLQDLLAEGCEIYAVSDRGRFVSYCVHSTGRRGITMEELYTVEDFRRHGAASLLVKKAEELAEEASSSLHFYLLPDDTQTAAFLASCGYHTLQSIEIVKDTGSTEPLTAGDLTLYRE